MPCATRKKQIRDATRQRTRHAETVKARTVHAQRRGVRPIKKTIDKLPPRLNSDPRPPSQNICQRCFGMPWARRPDRNDGSHGLVPVGDWECDGCGEPYAEEAPAERREVLRSNAGMALKW